MDFGKVNKVPMAELRAPLKYLGYAELQTLLNGGNAVFSPASRSRAKLATDRHCLRGLLSRGGAGADSMRLQDLEALRITTCDRVIDSSAGSQRSARCLRTHGKATTTHNFRRRKRLPCLKGDTVLAPS